jgi:hypothetical protein
MEVMAAKEARDHGFATVDGCGACSRPRSRRAGRRGAVMWLTPVGDDQRAGDGDVSSCLTRVVEELTLVSCRRSVLTGRG